MEDFVEKLIYLLHCSTKPMFHLGCILILKMALLVYFEICSNHFILFPDRERGNECVSQETLLSA